MKNLERYMIFIAVLVRVLLALPLSYLYIKHFTGLGKFESLFVGVGLIITFETLMIATSIIGIEIRKKELSNDFANFMLFIAFLLAVMASYSIFHLSELFPIKDKWLTTTPLHLINWVSFILLESVGIMHEQIREAQEIAKQHEERKAKYEADKAERLRIEKAENTPSDISESKRNVSGMNTESTQNVNKSLAESILSVSKINSESLSLTFLPPAAPVVPTYVQRSETTVYPKKLTVELTDRKSVV